MSSSNMKNNNQWNIKLRHPPPSTWFEWEESIIRSLLAEKGGEFANAIRTGIEKPELLDPYLVIEKYKDKSMSSTTSTSTPSKPLKGSLALSSSASKQML